MNDVKNFWKSGTGKTLTGLAKDSFLDDFSLIPNGTTCNAFVESFLLVDELNKFDNSPKKYYEISWKLCDGEYINRKVSQKIKCFDGKDVSIDRNLNMLMLIMNLFDFKPSHAGAPTTDDLSSMVGKIAAVKINEWEFEKPDGSGTLTGNNVSEVHSSGSLPIETGVQLYVVKKPSAPTPVARQPDTSTAFSRNHGVVDALNDGSDIPF